MAKAKQVYGWGDIPQETFEAFYKAVEKLRDEMIPRDCDGDSPIEVLIVNKMTHEGINYFPVPRNEIYSYITHGFLEVHPDMQADLDVATERELSNNIHMAANALDRYMRLKQHHHYTEAERKRPFAVRIKAACSNCKNKVEFNPDNEADFSGIRMRAKYPDYPSRYHIAGHGCTAFEIRRAQWESKHPEYRGPEPEPRWCMNPECRAKLPEYNSKKGVKDKSICLNSRCRLDNSKHYPEAANDSAG